MVFAVRRLIDRIREEDEEERRRVAVRQQAALARKWDRLSGSSPPSLNPLGTIYEQAREQDSSLRPQRFVRQQAEQERMAASLFNLQPPAIEPPANGLEGLAQGFAPPPFSPAGPITPEEQVGLGGAAAQQFFEQVPPAQFPMMTALGGELQQRDLTGGGFMELIERARAGDQDALGIIESIVQGVPSGPPAFQAPTTSLGLPPIVGEEERQRALGLPAGFAVDVAPRTPLTMGEAASFQDPFRPGAGIGPLLGEVGAELRGEVEMGRPATEPTGGFLGRMLAENIAGVPFGGLLRQAGVPVPESPLAGPLETAGRVGFPEVAVPTSAVPIPFVDPLVAKGVGLLGRGVKTAARPLLRRAAPEAAEQAVRQAPLERVALPEVPVEARAAEAALPGQAAPAEAAAAPRPVPDEETARAAAELERMGVQPMGGGNPVQRFREAIEEAHMLRPQQAKLRREELARRAGAVGAELRREGTFEERLARARSRQRGELPSVDIEPLSATLRDNEIADLAGLIDDHFRRFTPQPEAEDIFQRLIKARDFDWTNTLDAFRRLVIEGSLPRPFEVKLFEQVFGSDIALALTKARGLNLTRELGALINLPRTNLVVFDHSMVFRQDAITALNPRWAKETAESFATSIRALRSRPVAESLEAAMRETPEYMVAQHHGVDFSRLRGITFEGVEEPFIGALETTYVGRLARRLNPGIEVSERIATVYLNQKRLKLFARFVRELEKSGQPVTDNLLDETAELVNTLTGRARLPGALRPSLPILNAVFFSARLNMSRVKAPWTIARAVLGGENRIVGMKMARDMGAFIGTGATILGAVKASGLGGVELDPRSTDFGKIKVGNTRLDPWGGFQPFVRFIAQAASGERKTALGEIIPTDIKELAWRFIRTKFSPQLGIVSDSLSGENIVGEEVNTELGNLKRLAFESLVPLFIQDVVDAYREMGLRGIPLALPGVLGINILSYTSESVVKADAIEEAAGEGLLKGEYRLPDGGVYFPLRFGELDDPDQIAVQKRFPELFGREVLEQTSQERLEDVPESAQRLIRGTTVGEAQQNKAQRLEEIAGQASRVPAGDQQARRNLTESIKDALSDYGAVVAQSFEQFTFEGDEETFSRAQELGNRYRALSEEHNSRFTLADPEARDAAWAVFENQVERSFTPEELRILDEQRLAYDTPVERAWHQMNAQLASYYDLAETPRSHRERWRRQNAQADGMLWALGRIASVMPGHEEEAAAAFFELFGVRIGQGDVSRRAGIGLPGMPSMPSAPMPRP